MEMSLKYAVVLAMGLAVPAESATLKFNGLNGQSGDDWFAGFTYSGRDNLQTLNRFGAVGLEKLSLGLEMEARSPLARGLFLLTAGQGVARYQWANSVMSHEYAHFQHGRAFGFSDYYFRDSEDGEIFGWQEAWRRSFLTGSPRGPAVSARGDRPFDEEGYASRGHMVDAAGSNWQMTYSASRVREFQFTGSESVFMAPDLYMNRLYPSSYVLWSYASPETHEEGDPTEYAQALEERVGTSNVLEKMALVSAASLLFSPSAIFAPSQGISEYVRSGEMTMKAPGYDVGLDKRISYDLPYYLNRNSVTMAPTVYMLDKDGGFLGTDRSMFGVSLEYGVIGDQDIEVWMTADLSWDKVLFGGGLGLGPDGVYAQAEVSYTVDDNFGIGVAGVREFGTTLRGDRNLPLGDDLYWFGANYTF